MNYEYDPGSEDGIKFEFSKIVYYEIDYIFLKIAFQTTYGQRGSDKVNY